LAPAWAGWLLANVDACAARLAPPKNGGAAYFKAFKKELLFAMPQSTRET